MSCQTRNDLYLSFLCYYTRRTRLISLTLAELLTKFIDLRSKFSTSAEGCATPKYRLVKYSLFYQRFTAYKSFSFSDVDSQNLMIWIFRYLCVGI